MKSSQVLTARLSSRFHLRYCHPIQAIFWKLFDVIFCDPLISLLEKLHLSSRPGCNCIKLSYLTSGRASQYCLNSRRLLSSQSTFFSYPTFTSICFTFSSYLIIFTLTFFRNTLYFSLKHWKKKHCPAFQPLLSLQSGTFPSLMSFLFAVYICVSVLDIET